MTKLRRISLGLVPGLHTIELIDRVHGPRKVMIELAGAEVLRHYGPLGGPYRSSLTRYIAANVAADKVAAALHRMRLRGYIDGERNPELEAASDRAPDAAEPYLVYADWLSQHGDPRGELINVATALDARPEDAVLAARERELFAGSWLSFADPRWRWLKLTWRYGFVEGIEIDREDTLEAKVEVGFRFTVPLLEKHWQFTRSLGEVLAGPLSRIFHHPSGRFVRRIQTPRAVYSARRVGRTWQLERTS